MSKLVKTYAALRIAQMGGQMAKQNPAMASRLGKVIFIASLVLAVLVVFCFGHADIKLAILMAFFVALIGKAIQYVLG